MAIIKTGRCIYKLIVLYWNIILVNISETDTVLEYMHARPLYICI